MYRSDHANERAEIEAQEALMAAERDAEEAAALLSKSILARYHEEQIWSDKIRRMSTWGTWGLMGVNVLLFLVFQIAVEPWRRRRLVRGFEEKVMEALEKENGKESAKAQQEQQQQEQPQQNVVSEPASSIPDGKLVEQVGSTASLATVQTDESTRQTKHLPSTIPGETGSESAGETTPTTRTSEENGQPMTSLFPPDASLSPDSWRQTMHDMFSDRRLTLSQRDLTTVALESAAAGAAVMGVLIAVFRPR